MLVSFATRRGAAAQFVVEMTEGAGRTRREADTERIPVAAVQLDGVCAGNAKGSVHTIGFQKDDQLFSAGGHEAIVALFYCCGGRQPWLL